MMMIIIIAEATSAHFSISILFISIFCSIYHYCLFKHTWKGSIIIDVFIIGCTCTVCIHIFLSVPIEHCYDKRYFVERIESKRISCESFVDRLSHSKIETSICTSFYSNSNMHHRRRRRTTFFKFKFESYIKLAELHEAKATSFARLQNSTCRTN